MRWLLALWATPLAAFWGWYLLSVNNVNFGYVLLTRDANELIFQLYGEMLGMDPATIPPLIARACVLDTALLAAIIAFRRRRAIMAWARGFQSPAAHGADPVPPAE